MVRDEAGFGREPAAIASGSAGIDHFLAIQEEQRERLFRVLDVGQLADRGARLAAGRDAVAGGERPDRPADRIDQDVAVRVAPLVHAAEDRRRPLAGAADAHDVVAHLRVAVDHLRERVVGGVERYLHRLDRCGGHRRGEIRTVERSRSRVELDVAQRPGDAEVLVPAEKFVERDHDRAAPAGVGGVHRAGLRRRAFVLEHELGTRLAQSQHDAIGAAVARTAALDVGTFAPDAVGQALQFFEKRGFRVVDDAPHHSLDHFRSVAPDQRQHPVAGGDVARELGPEVERDGFGLARGAKIKLLDVAPDLVAFHDFDRRDADAFLERGLRRAAERRRRDAAEIVLMQAVGHPAEKLALPEHRADEHDVLLMRRSHPGVVGEEHVAVADSGIVAAVFENPFHLRIGDAGHVLHVRPEVHELAVLGEDRRIQVERIHGNRRAGNTLDRRAMLFVHVPERVPNDLVGDRVDVAGSLALELELGGDRELLRRHVARLPAVEGGAFHFAHLGHRALPFLRMRILWVRIYSHASAS